MDMCYSSVVVMWEVLHQLKNRGRDVYGPETHHLQPLANALSTNHMSHLAIAANGRSTTRQFSQPHLIDIADVMIRVDCVLLFGEDLGVGEEADRT
jgi:hypothetical protein